MRDATAASSAALGAVVSRGAAATRLPAWRATPNAATISGTLPSLTCRWTLATRSNENHPTRLAAKVSATAAPIPSENCPDSRKRNSSSRCRRWCIPCQRRAAAPACNVVAG